MVQLYCSEQISIPESFPNILKTFAKAAIRTQPYDILQWSAAYFRCLANNAPPPAKIRLERDCRQGSLTKGYLKVLVAQVGKGFFISRCLLQERWKALCLPEDDLRKYLSLSRMLNWPQVHWLKLLAVMIGCLNKTPQDTMVMVCELLTDDVDGGLARIPYWMFKICYTFVAELDCSKEQSFVNGQMVLPWGDLEEVTPMDTVPRVLSATLLKDTIITSCKAKFDKPTTKEVCTCPLDTSSDTASTIFMINSKIEEPKELLTQCEDFDTIMLLLTDTPGKPMPEREFRGPHYMHKKQLFKAQKIEDTCQELRQERCDKNAQQAHDHLQDEAFQMLKEIGPPWTWLHQFTVNDNNTASYNFIDQESIISDATPDLTSVDSFDIIKEEPKREKEESASSSCYLSECEMEEHRMSMESLKSLLDDATKQNKCDPKQTSSVLSYLKSEELCVMQEAGERFKPPVNVNEIIKAIERADANGLMFENVEGLINHVDACLKGRMEDFPTLTPRTTERMLEGPSTPDRFDICCVPCRDFEVLPVPPEWAETIPKQVEVPPRGPCTKIEKEKKPEGPKKEEITAIFDSALAVPPEQMAKMPKFCFEQKDSDELILGLVSVEEAEEEAEEEDLGSPLPESDNWSNKGYRSDDEDIFDLEPDPPINKVPPDDMKHYCCVDAPALESKPYLPPAEQFNCTLAPLPGIGGAVSQKTIDDFLAFLRIRSRSQKGLINPRNFKEEKCPYMVDRTLCGKTQPPSTAYQHV